MTDHQRTAVLHLEQVADLRDELLHEYDDPSRRRGPVISQLHQDIGRELKLAHINAELATAQAVHDLHNLLDERLSISLPARPLVQDFESYAAREAAGS